MGEILGDRSWPRRNRRRTARALQMTSSRLLVCMFLTKLYNSTEQLNWHLQVNTINWRSVPFTDDSRFTLSTLTGVKESGDATVNVMLLVTSSSVTGLAVGQWLVWSYIANGTLTAVRHQNEILSATVRPYTGAVCPRFLLVQHNARPHVARVYRPFLDEEGIDDWCHWPALSFPLTYIQLRTAEMRMPSSATDCPGAHDALVQVWKEIP